MLRQAFAMMLFLSVFLFIHHTTNSFHVSYNPMNRVTPVFAPPNILYNPLWRQTAKRNDTGTKNELATSFNSGKGWINQLDQQQQHGSQRHLDEFGLVEEIDEHKIRTRIISVFWPIVYNVSMFILSVMMMRMMYFSYLCANFA